MHVLHTCLNVADADRAVEWYVEQLGFEFSWEFETDDGRNRYVTDGNGVELQFSETEGHEPSEDGDRWDHVAVAVEDVDAAFERIENHGVEREPTDMPAANSRVAFIRDPDGHVVELVQPL
jgi:lactoylglutathione lyase